MWLSLKIEDTEMKKKKNFLSQSGMHATELRNEVKSSGLQTACLATNKAV